MVVRFTVWLTVPLKEVPRAQLLVAVIARKVLRVPRLAQRRDHLAHDRFLAGVAASLLRRRYSASAHVGVQVAEHRIQMVALRQCARRRLGDCRVRDSFVGLGVIRYRLHLVAAVAILVIATAAAVHLQLKVDY